MNDHELLTPKNKSYHSFSIRSHLFNSAIAAQPRQTFFSTLGKENEKLSYILSCRASLQSEDIVRFPMIHNKEGPHIINCGRIVTQKEYSFAHKIETDVYGKFLFKDENDKWEWEFNVEFGYLELYFSNHTKLPSVSDYECRFTVESSKVIVLEDCQLFDAITSKEVYFHIQAYGQCTYSFTVSSQHAEGIERFSKYSIDKIIKEVKKNKDFAEEIYNKANLIKIKRKSMIRNHTLGTNIVQFNKNVITSFNQYISNGKKNRESTSNNVELVRKSKKEYNVSNTARIIIKQNRWSIKKQIVNE